jgi:hypothetical protein
MAATNVLYVEGANDLHVISALLSANGFRDGRLPKQPSDGSHYFVADLLDSNASLRIAPNGTVDTLADVLKVQLKLPNVSRVAVVADANSDLSARWASFRSVLQQAGYAKVPDSLPATGLVLTERDRKTVGAWLMPDNVSGGYLESFLCRMIPNDDVLWPQARAAVNGIPEQDRRFDLLHREKAELFTWLAWQREPGKRMAESIKAGSLDPECAVSTAFVSWLNQWLRS